MDAVVHLDDAANHRRVAAELVLPIRVTQQQHRVGAMDLVARDERSAEHGLNTQHLEKRRGHDAGIHAIGFTLLEQRERHAVVLDKIADRLKPFAIAGDLGNRDAGVGHAGSLGRLLQDDELVAVPEREGLEQHAVEHGEHRGIRADTYSENQRGRERVARRPAQGACADQDVATEMFPASHGRPCGVRAGKTESAEPVCSSSLPDFGPVRSRLTMTRWMRGSLLQFIAECTEPRIHVIHVTISLEIRAAQH